MARQLLYKTATGLILSHGFTTFSPAADEAVLVVPDSFTADPRVERADPTSLTGKRSATATEITAFDAAQADVQAAIDVDQKVLRAVLAYVVQRLNELRTQPGTAFPALTATQVRDGIVAIYKTL